jgi:hypothetical protein
LIAAVFSDVDWRAIKSGFGQENCRVAEIGAKSAGNVTVRSLSVTP